MFCSPRFPFFCMHALCMAGSAVCKHHSTTTTTTTSVSLGTHATLCYKGPVRFRVSNSFSSRCRVHVCWAVGVVAVGPQMKNE
ncbi:hypothetical protein B0T09DRAFT_44016 [Sordaria sp. MPI-SDFR-AT-0083]|nr:hypothetical protein B0T09DRAFT_44016 [Sordaria sp. MPI-SDFR-AT-0083]